MASPGRPSCSETCSAIGKSATLAAIAHNDPAKLDRSLLEELFARHAKGRSAERRDQLFNDLAMLSDPDELPGDIDMFGESGFTSAQEIIDVFSSRFFFGCEADDPMNVLAFSRDLNPGGVTLPAIFASDVGHWDVRDMREVLPEAYELVEHGQITEEDFADFVFVEPGQALDLDEPLVLRRDER